MHILKQFGCGTIFPILGPLLGYFAFLILAGFVLVLIEQGDDEKVKDSKRLEFLKVLDKYNISYNDTMIQEVVNAASEAIAVSGIDLTDYKRKLGSEWHIGSAVFFAGTIVTTIGYGNIVPRTTGGKAFCIVIALLGLPFTGIVLGKIGVAFTKLIKKADAFIEARMKQCFSKSSADEKMKGRIRKIQLGFVFSLFVILFLLVPAAIFVELEDNWSYFDSFYFCFISLTTIGLGDLTPGGSVKSISLKQGISKDLVQNSFTQASVMLYLLFGLAALSIMLAMVGSILQSAAEKTLQSGTSLIAKGGQALKDAGGLELMTETRKLASSIKKKTASTLRIGQSESSSSSNDQINAEPGVHMIKNAFVEDTKDDAEEDDGKNCNVMIVVESKTSLDGESKERIEMISQDDENKNKQDERNEGIGDETEHLVVAFSNGNENADLPTAASCDK